MKFFSRVIAGVLTAAVLFALVPADVTRADSPRVEITLDTAFVRHVFSDTTSSIYVAGRDDNTGRFTTDLADSCVSVVADGDTVLCNSVEYTFSNDRNPDHRFLDLYYVMDDLSLFEAGSSVNVTINGVPLYCSMEEYNATNYRSNEVAGVEVFFSRFLDYGIMISFSPSFLGTVEMYRLYNPNSGEHFYTSNPDERAMLIGVGWNDEGTGWIAPNMTNVPVYRLYNPYAGEHHYTTNPAERDALVAAGWNDEGIGWYSYEGFGWYADAERTLPLQRYTTDDFERAIFLSAGWRDIGGGWYSGDIATAPLYREYNPNEFANNHNYTTDRAEHEFLVSLGWYDEGTGWYGVG